VSAVLGWVMAYQRPFRVRVARDGLLAVAPVSVTYVLVTLVVSVLWRNPGAARRAVSACCAWRAADLAYGRLVPLFGSALLVCRPVEAVWTVAAVWLLLGPLEAIGGRRRLLLLGAVGHAVPTMVIDLCWLVSGRVDAGVAGSLPVALALATGLAVDLAAAPDLATAEHLVAAAIGVGGGLILRR